MPVVNSQVPVSSTRTRLSSADDNDNVLGSSIVIHNVGASSMWIGNSLVTSDTGYELSPGAVFTCDTVSQRDLLYGVSRGSDTTTAHVLQIGV